MKKTKDSKQQPSHNYSFLVNTGMDEAVALEIDNYAQQKGKRKKRIEIKNKKEDQWK